MPDRLFHAERIFDGTVWHDNAILRVANGRVVEILSGVLRVSGVSDASGVASVPNASGLLGTASDSDTSGASDTARTTAKAEHLPGWLVPGLIDLQVNGGGGVLFNNAPTPEGIATICAAHARFGTTSVMVTLITDRPDVTAAAVLAGEEVAPANLLDAPGGSIERAAAPGFLGLHLEGPHLDKARKGTHDPNLIRPMDAADLTLILQAAQSLPHLICTIAPEAVTLPQVHALSQAGVTVSLGHTDCDDATARAYAGAGATMVTHLFNAMSPLTHRAPGLVGAALDDKRLSAGLIADGFHVDPTALRVALRAKLGTMFLVSDAMSTVGSDLTGFILNGRQIYRNAGRLTLADGTLAGADIALIDAVRYVHQTLGLPLEHALHLATTAPAAALKLTDRGHLRPGARADFVCLTPDIRASSTWISGDRVA